MLSVGDFVSSAAPSYFRGFEGAYAELRSRFSASAESTIQRFRQADYGASMRSTAQ
jgi:hypothetical protein